MTTFTATYNYVGTHNSDATFRTLARDYSELLAGSGLGKVSTTGAIDFSTVLRPTSANSVVGFEIWRFNDELQAASPIFLKVEYGTGPSSSASLGLWITIGTGVTSTGSLTGIVGTRTSITPYFDDKANVSSYSCHTEGFFGVVNRVGGSVSASYPASGSFVICRSCDPNGYPTGDGVYVLCGIDVPKAQSMRLSNGGIVISGFSANVVQFPLGVGVTIGGEVPLFPVWMPLPALVPVFGLAAFPETLVSGVDFIDVAMVGTRIRRYICGPTFFNGRTAGPAFAMLWE